jgi:bisanhydrobacterioruberin hydratase
MMKTLCLKEKETKIFFVVFYSVGIAGLIFPGSYSLFIALIPWSLLLNVICLALFHHGPLDVKTSFVFLFICLFSIGVEIAGVNSQCIFGAYHYQESLGIRLFNTPLIIGLNWLFLTYSTSSVMEDVKMPVVIKITSAATLMVVYDIVLEQVAPKLEMWEWNNGIVPLRNYLVWFALAVIFHSLIKSFGIKTRNPLSLVILVSQFVFFIALILFMR